MSKAKPADPSLLARLPESVLSRDYAYVTEAGGKVFAVFFDRRRYGSRHSPQWYTWVWFADERGEVASPVIDPWPQLRPKRAEVEAVLAGVAAGTFPIEGGFDRPRKNWLTQADFDMKDYVAPDFVRREFEQLAESIKKEKAEKAAAA